MKRYLYAAVWGTLLLFVSACDDTGPMDKCCTGLSETQEARELDYRLFPDTVYGLKITDMDKIDAASATEYLCAKYPAMKNLNNKYERLNHLGIDNNPDFKEVCSEPISKLPTFLNDVEKAYTDCCIALAPKNPNNDFDMEYKCNDKSDSAEKEKCLGEMNEHHKNYLSCFVTFLTKGICEME